MENNFVISEKIKAEPGQRFINYILDLMIRFFLLSIFMIVWAWVVHFFTFLGIDLYTMVDGDRYYDDGESSDWNAYFMWMIFSFGYFAITEMLFSRTFSKFITGTCVVSEDGSKPRFSAILIRTFLRFIPILDFVSFLYEKGWHDRFSKTTVVKKTVFEESKKLFLSIDELGKTQI